MSRIDVPTRDGAPRAAKVILDAVYVRLGFVPNLYRLVSLSPDVLAGFEAMSAALNGVLDARTRARIALAVAQANGCDYCLSSHSYFGMNIAGLGPEEILRNRCGTSADRQAAAAIWFAVRVVESAGRVTDQELVAVRAAGFDDAGIVDIAAVAAQNVLTNFINNVAATAVDFPLVTAVEAA